MENTAPDKLKAWMDRNGVRKGWFAAQVPVTGSQLSRWINGKANPSRMAQARIETLTGGDVPVSAWKDNT